MNLKISYNLWKTKRTLTPDSQFKKQLWTRLEQVLEAEQPVFWYRQVWFKWSAVGVMSLLVVASLGTGVYAYNSPEVTEGTLLYPVKQKLEQAEEAIQIRPEAKAKFYLKQLARREAEAVVNKKQGKNVEQLDKKIEKVESQLANTEKILEKMQLKDKELKPKIKERLEKTAELRQERLEKKLEKIEDKKQDKSVSAPKEGRVGNGKIKFNN